MIAHIQDQPSPSHGTTLTLNEEEMVPIWVMQLNPMYSYDQGISIPKTKEIVACLKDLFSPHLNATNLGAHELCVQNTLVIGSNNF